MSWTDERLWALERQCVGLSVVPDSASRALDQAELYRLARLGLAAEQVGRDGFEELREDGRPTGSQMMAFRDFCLSPAWSKP